jgi:hypothetical protein
VADAMFAVVVDYQEVARMLEKLGPAAEAHCLSVAHMTAIAVKQEAVRRIARGVPGETYKHIIFQGKKAGWPGYVVMLDDVVPPRETARRRAMGLKRIAKSKYYQVKHTGLWLEYGYKGLRAKGPRPWLFPAARAEESGYLRRMAEALSRAIAEVGG